jgi:hypothetical protein
MRTRYRKILVAAALTALALTAIFASVAEAATPAAPYEDFAGCQSFAENEAVASCAKLTLNNGQLVLGKRDIPITAPVVLRGDLEQRTQQFNYNAEGGIQPVRQTVQGGLLGSTGNSWLDELLAEHEAFRVHATIESAGQPGTFNKFPLTVPVKVHLENPLLGNTCYIGSEASPIVLNLTTGTTNPPAPATPITGKAASKLEAEAERPAVRAQNGGVLVDNTFATPAAEGCQINVGPFHVNIDEAVNQSWGLPAAAGVSEGEFGYTYQLVSAAVVYP